MLIVGVNHGRIERGFDFLGYNFSPAGLTVARKTIENFIKKASRLYEQERRTPSDVSPFEMYVRRWVLWTQGGLYPLTLLMCAPRLLPKFARCVSYNS